MISAQNGLVWHFHGPFAYVLFVLLAGASFYLAYRKWQQVRGRRRRPGDDDFRNDG